jgi:hypothetical protein
MIISCGKVEYEPVAQPLAFFSPGLFILIHQPSGTMAQSSEFKNFNVGHH